MDHEEYQNPLCTRYASKAMRRLFSDEFKFKTWRKLWAALAQAQFELGLDGVTEDRVKQIQNLQNIPIDYAFVEEKEKLLRHDVMSHVHEVATHIPGKMRIFLCLELLILSF
jgi:adenylosuccinate lyase